MKTASSTGRCRAPHTPLPGQSLSPFTRLRPSPASCSALPAFRDELVQATASPDPLAVQSVVDTHARRVVTEMRRTAAAEGVDTKHLKRLADKQLFNYRNIGFIRLMFPHAVILHTMRDPMDTLFSCYKVLVIPRPLSSALSATLSYALVLSRTLVHPSCTLPVLPPLAQIRRRRVGMGSGR